VLDKNLSRLTLNRALGSRQLTKSFLASNVDMYTTTINHPDSSCETHSRSLSASSEGSISGNHPYSAKSTLSSPNASVETVTPSDRNAAAWLRAPDGCDL
jgi:hypothetical protein